jgi:hypothetical protein
MNRAHIGHLEVSRLPRRVRRNITGLCGSRDAQDFFGSCFAFIHAAAHWLKSRVTEPFLSETGAATHIGSFAGAPQGSDSADLSPLLEDAMQSRKEVSLELVVKMFRNS